jgi:hypothetical protein
MAAMGDDCKHDPLFLRKAETPIAVWGDGTVVATCIDCGDGTFSVVCVAYECFLLSAPEVNPRPRGTARQKRATRRRRMQRVRSREAQGRKDYEAWKSLRTLAEWEALDVSRG